MVNWIIWKVLGVDVICIVLCFPSPQVDFGYDVSDYENIDRMYGTLADFLLAAKDGPGSTGSRSFWTWWLNHTSDQASVVSGFAVLRATAAKRDWYIWRDSKVEGPRTTGFRVWWIGVAVRPAKRTVLLPLFLSAAAQFELA